MLGLGNKKQGRDSAGQFQPVVKSPTQGVDTSKFVTPKPTRKASPLKAKGVRGSYDYDTLMTAYNILIVKARAGAFTR